MATILCVDDDPATALILADTLEHAGHVSLRAASVAEALSVLAARPVDLIISDYRMPETTGLDFLHSLAREGCETPLIMVTGFASIEHAVASIKAGAVDYITKPIRPAQLELAVDQALELVELRRENAALRREVLETRSQRRIIGESPTILRAVQAASTAAPTRATVLLHGESGTGKELFAHAIHEQSERRHKPFIKLNCAALPEGLVESALFGHERGAFTGAVKRVQGAFERAHGGTLLLDEISEMRLDLQAKLLRVLQEQEFERVGGTSPIRVDVRVVATTNRDLAAEAAAGRFRQDLFFRLSVIPVRIPPLRERKEDIPLLAHRFALRAAADANKEITGLTPEAATLLQGYDWPGNVRELQHVVERAVILSSDPLLHPRHLAGDAFPWLGPEDAPGPGPAAAPSDDGAVLLNTLSLAEAESVLIARALQVTGSNRTRAAELLGISVRTLRYKLNGSPRDAA